MEHSYYLQMTVYPCMGEFLIRSDSLGYNVAHAALHFVPTDMGDLFEMLNPPDQHSINAVGIHDFWDTYGNTYYSENYHISGQVIELRHKSQYIRIPTVMYPEFYWNLKLIHRIHQYHKTVE